MRHPPPAGRLTSVFSGSLNVSSRVRAPENTPVVTMTGGKMRKILDCLDWRRRCGFLTPRPDSSCPESSCRKWFLAFPRERPNGAGREQTETFRSSPSRPPAAAEIARPSSGFHSSGKGLPRNYNGCRHVLSANQSPGRQSKSGSSTDRGLRKAFSGCPSSSNLLSGDRKEGERIMNVPRASEGSG